MVTLSNRTLFHIYACALGLLLLFSHVYSASLGLYDAEEDITDSISRLIDRGLYSERMPEKRSDLPPICKRKGIECEHDLMGLYLRPRRTVITHKMGGKRADLPMLCKKMGVACEDDLMGLWLRLMPDRHRVQV